jgi:molybdate transport system substrate-binding protein
VIRSFGKVWAVAALVAAGVTAAACSTSPSATTKPPTLHGSITVSAASSLTDSFNTLAKSFEARHHGTNVVFNFGSSATLLTQIQTGAPADVFASAGSKEMNEAVMSGNIEGHPTDFARNTMEIVVKPGNPLGIHFVADLTKAQVVSLCVVSAPCGAAAQMVLHNAGVALPASQVTLGDNVSATLQAVTTGDAEAGIVYVTDAKGAGSSVTTVRISTANNVVTEDVMAVVKGTQNASLARAWVSYVAGPVGQRVLRQAGFLPPAR